METHFAQTIQTTSSENDVLLDQSSKKVLLQIPILVRILKNTVKEFKSYTHSEIEEILKNREEIKESLEPDFYTSIQSDDRKLPTEENKAVTCDILFETEVGTEEKVKIYIDLEAQTNQSPRICDCEPWNCLYSCDDTQTTWNRIQFQEL